MNDLVLYNGAYSGPQVDAAVSRALSGGALDQAIAALRAAVGSPLVAATAAAMTDTSKIYVYTGSEAGYTSGHWYYWDGSVWADGGAYNSAAADAAMSDSSINAVQNKVIKAAIDAAETAAKEVAYGAFPTESSSGAIAATEIGADGIPLKSAVIAVDAIWKGSGTPTTGNIREIVGFAGVTITRAGKNLLDPSVFADTTESGGVYTKGSEYAELNHGNAIFLPGGSYVCSFNNPGGDFSKVSWATVKGAVGEAPFSVSGDGYSTCSFTLLEAAYVSVLAGACSFSEPQLEVGSARSDYEAYDGNAYAINWQDEVGTLYGGTFDATTGVITATMWGHVFDGSESFSFFTTSHYSIYWSLPFQGLTSGEQTYRIPYSSHYVAATDTQAPGVPHISISTTGNSLLFTRVNADGTGEDEGKVSIPAFKTYLAAQYANETPVTVVWRLATPRTYQLTAAGITSLFGANSVFSDIGGNVTATFRCDPTLALEQLQNAILSLGNNT